MAFTVRSSAVRSSMIGYCANYDELRIREKKKKPSYFSYYKLVTDRCRLNPITIINGIGTSEKCLLNRLLIDNNNKSLSRRYIRKQYWMDSIVYGLHIASILHCRLPISLLSGTRYCRCGVCVPISFLTAVDELKDRFKKPPLQSVGHTYATGESTGKEWFDYRLRDICFCSRDAGESHRTLNYKYLI